MGEQKQCSECNGELYANGLCRKHYDRMRRRGTTEAPAPAPKPECSEEECTKPQHSQGLCQMHYRRLRKHGSTTVPQRVNKPGPKPDPSKPYSKHKPPTPRVYEEKTHCPQGHPYDDENTYVDDSGYKHCRTCRRERMAVRRPATIGQGGHNAAKTHCPRGHEYTAENTIRSKDDRRFCRACYNANNPRRVARKYGISVEKVEEMLRDQDDQCAICLVPFDGKTPDIDHDHSCCPGQKACGKCVRGLLCHGCNVGLGYFGDAVVRLRAAISYLESFQQ